MTHGKPTISAPIWTDPATPETLSLDIRVITPLFGGGYEPRETDPDCPVRAAAVRGHLRFWWRATSGARYESSEALYQAEQALWGSAQKCGQVSVRTEVQDRGTEQACARFERRPDGSYRPFPLFEPYWPSYALMPFQGKATRDGIETAPGVALVGVKFRLVLSATREADTKNWRDETLEAARAWIRFGGVGARTRRGCGSLASDYAFSTTSNGDVVSPEDLTILAQAVFLWGPQQSDPLRAWNEAVTIYRDFRQKEGFARNTGQQPNRPGRSRWPEPDAIRRIAGHNAPNHPPQHLVTQGFPRADLGLPIIFHFVDRGDPGDATLEGPAIGQSRFASPVITRAVQIGPAAYRPLILILNAPHVWRRGDLQMKVEGRAVTIGRGDIELSPDQQKLVMPMKGKTVRDALAAYAVNRGFRQEVPS